MQVSKRRSRVCKLIDDVREPACIGNYCWDTKLSFTLALSMMRVNLHMQEIMIEIWNYYSHCLINDVREPAYIGYYDWDMRLLFTLAYRIGNYYFNMKSFFTLAYRWCTWTCIYRKLLFQYEIIFYVGSSMMYLNLQSPAERSSLVSVGSCSV